MARGFFLPIAVEGEYGTYISTMSVRYSLIPSYIATLILLFTFDVGLKSLFIYQLSILFLVHMVVHVHFIFWFNRHFGLEKIVENLTGKQALISLVKSFVTLALLFLISLVTYAFFERGNVPVNIILSVIFPYIFTNLIHGALNEGTKGFLKFINYKKV